MKKPLLNTKTAFAYYKKFKRLKLWEECGVAPPLRDEFVGHSRGRLNNAYSDLSDEYLLKEGKKLLW